MIISEPLAHKISSDVRYQPYASVAACLVILTGHHHRVHHVLRVVPFFKPLPAVKFTCASK